MQGQIVKSGGWGKGVPDLSNFERLSSETKTITNTSTVTKTATTTITAPGATGTVTVTSTPTTEAPLSINLTINGGKYINIPIKPHWTLQRLLHDELKMLEIKAMCVGRGQCGSCSAIVNGRPVLTCLTLAATCNNAIIETSIGIAEAEHPLIESYIKNYCMQCGYCTPGFVTTAKALLDKNPDPTKEEIQLALEGNICRCGTYPAHIKAVQEAAAALKGAK
jgi:aerobic-type carbon monoxide dehydrogenase small subunit (CoxS/CutS family)